MIEPLGGFGAEVFRLFRCCAPVSWTCCEGGKTMWVKSSKSEMTFLNSAVFFLKLAEFAGAFADSFALFLPWGVGPRRGKDGWMDAPSL